MTNEEVLRRARAARRRYGTRDPFALAAAAGVRIRYCDFTSLRGLYENILGNAFIALQADRPDPLARTVLMHELGHHVLHRELAASRSFRVLADMPMTDRPEEEANLFAADMLVSDHALAPLLAAHMTEDAAAAELAVCPELVSLKLEVLARRGLRVNAAYPAKRFRL